MEYHKGFDQCSTCVGDVSRWISPKNWWVKNVSIFGEGIEKRKAWFKLDIAGPKTIEVALAKVLSQGVKLVQPWPMSYLSGALGGSKTCSIGIRQHNDFWFAKIGTGMATKTDISVGLFSWDSKKFMSCKDNFLSCKTQQPGAGSANLDHNAAWWTNLAIYTQIYRKIYGKGIWWTQSRNRQ